MPPLRKLCGYMIFFIPQMTQIFADKLFTIIETDWRGRQPGGGDHH